ncbi:MAG: helix-turn-helix transcriptional regulator [Pseudomonadota bacterium]
MTTQGLDPTDTLRSLGTRVSAARRAQGMPRRALSEASGVSPRFLAQLEAGTGNISVARLHQVATALNIPITHLLSEEPSADVAQRYARAPNAVQTQVRALLGLASDKKSRVCLIGLRGAGKSTLGAAAAALSDVPFVELSQEISNLAGMPVADVIALYGPEGYRRLEAQALEAVIDSHERLVLAVAGGLVTEPATFERLLTHFHTVWLRASPETHMARVRAQGDNRPMHGNPKAMNDLVDLLAEREALYAQADHELETSNMALDQSVHALSTLMEKVI